MQDAMEQTELALVQMLAQEEHNIVEQVQQAVAQYQLDITQQDVTLQTITVQDKVNV